MKNTGFFFFFAVLGPLLLLCSCQTPPSTTPETIAPTNTTVSLDIGFVAHVNEKMGYVILRCAVLPSEGEEVRVYRNEKETACLRVSGPKRPPYLSADVLSGAPRRDDRVRQVLSKPMK